MSVASLEARLSSGDPAIRKAAVRELALRRGTAARALLAASLDHRDPEVRRGAGAALGRAADAGEARLLARHARLEPDPRVRLALWRAAARAYRRSGAPSDLRMMARHMTEAAFPEQAFPDLCAAALHVLAARPAQLPGSLIAWLSMPALEAYHGLRAAAEDAIAAESGKRVARSLAPAYLELLGDAAFAGFHPAFLRALGRMRWAAASEALVRLLDEKPFLQRETLEALALIGLERLDGPTAAAARLQQEIRGRSPSEQEFSSFFFDGAQRLAAMGRAAVPRLLRLLDHPDAGMRENARFALEAMRDPDALLSTLRTAEAWRDAEKTRLAWELVSRHHPDHSLKALATDELRKRG